MFEKCTNDELWMSFLIQNSKKCLSLHTINVLFSELKLEMIDSNVSQLWSIDWVS